MLSKRLAIIYMLAKGYTFDSIQETLRVSPATIAKTWKGIERGKYAEIMKRLGKKIENDPDISTWFSMLLPPTHMTRKQYSERMRRLNL